MASRNAKGPYSNTGPLSHFETQPDLFGGPELPPEWAADRRFLAWGLTGLMFLPEPPAAPLFSFSDTPPVEETDLRSMWAASPLFQVEEGA